MDRSTGKNVTGTLAQWEAFFRTCEIPHEYSQAYAAKFVEERVRPHKLSTYTKEDYQDLGVKQGDRKEIEEYLKRTNGNPPQFGERKPIVRPPSASDDDIILETAPNMTAQSNGLERKPEDHNERSTISANNDKLRLSRPTAAARISKAAPPMEMIHEDEFPPLDLRNAVQQMSIDQLRRNGQLVEHNREATLAEQHPYSQRSLPACTEYDRVSSQSCVDQPSSLRRTQVDPKAEEHDNPENLIVEGAAADKGYACHDGEAAEAGPSKSAICGICGGSFATDKNLMKHARTACVGHPLYRSPKYECARCGKNFVVRTS